MVASNAGTFCKSVRTLAIGMIEVGCSQREVAECMSLTRHTVNKWWRRFVGIQPVEHRPRSGRPLTVNRGAKIVCAKAADNRD